MDIKVVASPVGSEGLAPSAVAGELDPLVNRRSAGQLAPLTSQPQRPIGSGVVRNGKEERRATSTPARNSSKQEARKSSKLEVKRRSGNLLEVQRAQSVGQHRRAKKTQTYDGTTASASGVRASSASGLRASNTQDEKPDPWLLPSFATSDHNKRAEVAAEHNAPKWLAEQKRLSKRAPGLDVARGGRKVSQPPSPAGSHEDDPTVNKTFSYPLTASLRRVTSNVVLGRLRNRRAQTVGARSMQALRETTQQARGLNRMDPDMAMTWGDMRNWSKSTYGASSDADSTSSQVDVQVRPKIDLVRLARDLVIPSDVVRQAADMFRKHASCPPTDSEAEEGSDVDPLADGSLTPEQIGAMFGDSTPQSMPTQAMNFQQFALWFFSMSFSESCNLTEEQREVRSMARKHDMAICTVDYYKKCFDQHDHDGSGFIDFNEFQALLNKMIRIPTGYSLPEKRVEQLFREVDEDSNGSINFWEFVHFYRKYFEQQDGSLSCPFEAFYSMSRTVSN